nr:MAG TPA: hypothetical protein [Caudoviricetes sp.]
MHISQHSDVQFLPDRLLPNSRSENRQQKLMLQQSSILNG